MQYVSIIITISKNILIKTIHCKKNKIKVKKVKKEYIRFSEHFECLKTNKKQ